MKKAMTGLLISTTLLLTGCNATLKNKAKVHAPVLFSLFESEIEQPITISKTRYLAIEFIGHQEDELMYMTTFFFDFKIPASVLTFYAVGIVAETLEEPATALGGFIYETIDDFESDYETTLEEIEDLKKNEVGKGKNYKSIKYHTGKLTTEENNAR